VLATRALTTGVLAAKALPIKVLATKALLRIPAQPRRP